MTPSSVLLTIASSDDSTMAASRAWASSARLRSVTSRKTRTAPTGAPALVPDRGALSSIGRSVPSLAMRTVWFASPTIVPSRRARRAGFSTGWRVCSLTMRKTSGRGRPTASAWGQPVSASATPFRNVTRPSASVPMTASPMLASVIRSRSRSCGERPLGPLALEHDGRLVRADAQQQAVGLGREVRPAGAGDHGPLVAGVPEAGDGDAQFPAAQRIDDGRRRLAGREPRGQRLGDRPHLARVGRQALAADDFDVTGLAANPDVNEVQGEGARAGFRRGSRPRPRGRTRPRPRATSRGRPDPASCSAAGGLPRHGSRSSACLTPRRRGPVARGGTRRAGRRTGSPAGCRR